MLTIDAIGVQSYCFRGFKEHDVVIAKVKEVGLSLVEMSGVHLKPDAPDREAVVKQYADAGLRLNSCGVQSFTGDEAADRPVFEFARLAGFSIIDCVFKEQDIDLLERLCEEYDMKLAIHNHGRKHDLGSVRALDERFSKTSPRVGLCLDTAWMLDSGEDPVAVAARFADRLYGLHVKDFVFDRAGKPEDVIVGTGNLDLDGLFKLLSDNHFDGFCSLEYEGDVNNPTPAVAECVQKMKESLARL